MSADDVRKIRWAAEQLQHRNRQRFGRDGVLKDRRMSEEALEVADRLEAELAGGDGRKP